MILAELCGDIKPQMAAKLLEKTMPHPPAT